MKFFFYSFCIFLLSLCAIAPVNSQQIGSRAFENIAFKLDVSKYAPESPVEPSKAYILDSFKSYIEFNHGKIDADASGNHEIYLKLVFSKFTTKKFYGSYLTEVDVNYFLYDDVNKSNLDENVISISCEGESQGLSKSDAMRDVIKRIFTNNHLTNALEGLKSGSDNRYARAMDKLSFALFDDFTGKFGSGDPIRIAFTGFTGENVRSYSSLFTASLKKYWSKGNIRIYSREELDVILNERSLHLSGLIDEKTAIEIGKLQAVECLIAGRISTLPGSVIVEAKVIKASDAEIVASKVVTIETVQ